MQRDYSKVIAKINRQIGAEVNNTSKVQSLIETFKQDFTDTALKVTKNLRLCFYKNLFSILF